MASDASFVVDVVLNIQNNIKKAMAPITKGAQTATRATSGLTNEFDSLNNQMIQHQRVGKQTFDIIKNATANAVKDTRNMNKEIKKIDFRFLGLMFAGMALQRTFGSAFRAILAGYTDFSEKNNRFQNEVLELSGAFQFLKFSIGQAFAESEFASAIINSFTGIVDRLATIISDNPNLGVILTSLAAGLAGVGIALSIIGQSYLGVTALSALSDAMPGLKDGIKGMPGKFKGFITSLNKTDIAAFGLIASLLILRGIISNYPPLDAELEKSYSGLAGSFLELADSIASLFGAELPEFATELEGVAKVGTVVFTYLFTGLELIIRTLSSLIRIVGMFGNIAITVFKNIGEYAGQIFSGVGNVISGAFSGDISKIKEGIDSIKATSIKDSFKKTLEESAKIADDTLRAIGESGSEFAVNVMARKTPEEIFAIDTSNLDEIKETVYSSDEALNKFLDSGLSLREFSETDTFERLRTGLSGVTNETDIMASSITDRSIPALQREGDEFDRASEKLERYIELKRQASRSVSLGGISRDPFTTTG